VRVVDQHAGRSAREVTQRVGEEHLAVKTLKGRVALKEQHPRVTQHGRGGLYLALLAGQLHFVRGSVVLHLLAGREVVPAHGRDGRLADAMPPAEGSQRRIGQLRPGGRQFLMDSHEIPLARAE
jgi:hypothetical protein